MNEDQSQPQEQEPLELLKREDVRTMSKDISKIREQQALQAREQLNRVHPTSAPAQEAVSTDALAQARAQQQQEALRQQEQQANELRSSLMPPAVGQVDVSSMPKPPSSFQKIAVRSLLGIAVLVLVGGSAAFVALKFFGATPQQVPQQAPSATQQPLVQQEQPQPVQQPLPPTPSPAILTTTQTTTIQFSDLQQAPSLITSFLSVSPTPTISRILLLNQTTNTYAELGEFTAAFKISIPLDVASVLNPSLTLVHYDNTLRSRPGFALTTLDPISLTQAMKAWESTMETDLAAFLNISGQKGTGYTKAWRASSYKGIPVRFQTFSSDDFGIVYAISRNTLLVTTSFESIKTELDAITPSVQ